LSPYVFPEGDFPRIPPSTSGFSLTRVFPSWASFDRSGTLLWRRSTPPKNVRLFGAPSAFPPIDEDGTLDPSFVRLFLIPGDLGEFLPSAWPPPSLKVFSFPDRRLFFSRKGAVLPRKILLPRHRVPGETVKFCLYSESSFPPKTSVRYFFL